MHKSTVGERLALAAKPCDPPAREEREQRETDRAIECSPEAGVKGAAAPLRGTGCLRPDSSFRAWRGEHYIALRNRHILMTEEIGGCYNNHRGKRNLS